VATLKHRPGKDLVVLGSGELVRSLMKHPGLGALVRAILTELQAAGRQLLTQAFGVIEPEVLTGASDSAGADVPS
jgi:hypothetical protein